MISQPKTSADLQANQDEAERMGATCPKCDALADVVVHHLQATRRKPCELLGVAVHCSCEPTFLEGKPQVAFIPVTASEPLDLELTPLVRTLVGDAWHGGSR